MRKASILLETKSGVINRFYARVNGKVVIDENGKDKRTWSGDINDSGVLFEIEAHGVDGSKYNCEINPGFPNSVHTISGGKDEFDVTL